MGQRAEGEDLDFPSEELSSRERDDGGGSRNGEGGTRANESSTSSVSRTSSPRTVAGALPPSADSREDLSHFSSCAAPDAQESLLLASAGVEQNDSSSPSSSCSQAGLDGHEDAASLPSSAPPGTRGSPLRRTGAEWGSPSSPLLGEARVLTPRENDGGCLSEEEERVKKPGEGQKAEEDQDGDGNGFCTPRVENESEKAVEDDEPEACKNAEKFCEALSSHAPEEEQEVLYSKSNFHSISLSSSSTPSSAYTTSTTTSSTTTLTTTTTTTSLPFFPPNPPLPPPPPPLPSSIAGAQRLDSPEVLRIPCTDLPSSESSSLSSSASSASLDNLQLISNICLLAPSSSIPQSILPASLLPFSSNSSSPSFLSSSSSSGNVKPSAADDPHLDPGQPPQSLLSSFSAGSLLWRVGKKFAHSGRAAVSVASRAASAAAVVTVGEPTTLVCERGAGAGAGEGGEGGGQGQGNSVLAETMTERADSSVPGKKMQRRAGGGGGGGGGAEGDEEKGFPDEDCQYVGRRREEEQEEDGVGGGEHGGVVPRRRPVEQAGEDHLRQEIEALREQIRIYHEALASMTSISPAPCPPSLSPTAEEHCLPKPSSPLPLPSSSSSPAPPAPLVKVPSPPLPPAVDSVFPASLREPPTSSPSSRSSSDSEEEEEEEEEKRRFLDLTAVIDRGGLKRRFEEEIIEILSSVAAPAAASAAVTATEAVLKEKLRAGKNVQNFSLSSWQIPSDVGSIAAATAVSLYEDETLFTRLVPVLNRIISEMLAAYNEAKRRGKKEKAKEEGEKGKRRKKRTRRRRQEEEKDAEAGERVHFQDGRGGSRGSDDARLARTTMRVCGEAKKGRGGGGEEEEAQEGRGSKHGEKGGQGEEGSSPADVSDAQTALEESTRSSSDSCCSCQACGAAVPLGICRHGLGGGGGGQEEIPRLMEKIRKQQADLDQQRDLNERQTKQIVQLTLQLTDLKTEEEERLEEERKKNEERKKTEEEEKRVYEVIESQRAQLDELTAAVAESFELKCHLQELGKTYSQTRDKLQVAEEELRQAREKVSHYLTRIGELEQELQERQKKTSSSGNTTSASPREREDREDLVHPSPLPEQSSSRLQEENREETERKEGKVEGSRRRTEEESFSCTLEKDGGKPLVSSPVIRSTEKVTGEKKEGRDFAENKTKKGRNETSKEGKIQEKGPDEDDVLVLSSLSEKGKGGSRTDECSALSQTTVESEEGEAKQDALYHRGTEAPHQPGGDRSSSSSPGQKREEEESLEAVQHRGTEEEEEKGNKTSTKGGNEEEAEERGSSKNSQSEVCARSDKERKSEEEKKIEELEQKIRSLQFELQSLHARYLCEEKRQLKQLQNLRNLCSKEKQKREKSEAETQRWMARVLQRQMVDEHFRTSVDDSDPRYVYRAGEGEGLRCDAGSHQCVARGARQTSVDPGEHTPERLSSDGRLVKVFGGRTSKECTVQEQASYSSFAELCEVGSRGDLRENSSLSGLPQEKDIERNTRNSRLCSSPPQTPLSNNSRVTTRLPFSAPSSSCPAASPSPVVQSSTRVSQQNKRHEEDSSEQSRQAQGGYEEESQSRRANEEVSHSSLSSLPPSADARESIDFVVAPASEGQSPASRDDESLRRKEVEQLRISQELLQVDVAKKAEIISFLLKKYALKEENFRGPPATSSSFPRSGGGWRQLAVAAAGAVMGRGKERGGGGGWAREALDFHEMQKIVEETVLENIRLRTDLATLAEDMQQRGKEGRARGQEGPEETLDGDAPLPLGSKNAMIGGCEPSVEGSATCTLVTSNRRTPLSTGLLLSANRHHDGNEPCVGQDNTEKLDGGVVESGQGDDGFGAAKKVGDSDRHTNSDLLAVSDYHWLAGEGNHRRLDEEERSGSQRRARKSSEEQQYRNSCLSPAERIAFSSPRDLRSQNSEGSPTQGELIEPLSEVILFHADA